MLFIIFFKLYQNHENIVEKNVPLGSLYRVFNLIYSDILSEHCISLFGFGSAHVGVVVEAFFGSL